ncbi:XRE family transcriptional regulator [Streptomyces griseoviridis]|uniref:Transcriptional regulator n=1 Tax=Streptomyces griseoviridis TaxID=45398 RepID=A0A3S9ZAF8_STRGD|nr:helix-turn-helix transcriptional regulator [Streptomyces griseoviridis]AZS84557.1 XRE family transcriptional regulator [Streptomyces griseoviridis]QCN88588.1 transcriptional regulator [Streptomyces griseoviridis]
MSEPTELVHEGAAGGDERQPEPEPGSGVLRVFGRQLKRFRVRAGLERPEFGSLTGYSVSTIAAYEQGRRVPPPKFIDRADEVLDAGGVLQEMKEEVARAQYPAFFRDAAMLEGEAVELWVYATQAVPGLLQTEEYMRAVFGMWRPMLDEETVEQRVLARRARQDILDRRPPPLISFVIDEAVVRRPLGGWPVMRGQLEQLMLVGALRHVEIQIMPLDREDNAGVDGPFTVLYRSGGDQVAYLEAQGRSTMVSDRREVQGIASRYGIIRAQALSPRESLDFIEKLLREV